MNMNETNIEVLVPYPNHLHNLSMKLVFDIYTPRPHFILLQQKEHRKIFITEKEIDDLIRLVIEFLRSQSQYDDQVILSFHCGQWYQQKQRHFHAHLCVPKQIYCQAVKTKINAESTGHYWSSSMEYLNQLEKEFQLSKKRYERYRQQCLSIASQCFHLSIPLEQFNTAQFRLVFLVSSPKIGVIAREKNLSLKDLYFFMHHFYRSAEKHLKAIDRHYENFGAHLCLFVAGKTKKKSNLIERNERAFIRDMCPIRTVRLVGYVQMDEQLYLRWLPHFFHSIWLNEFQVNEHFVVT